MYLKQIYPKKNYKKQNYDIRQKKKPYHTGKTRVTRLILYKNVSTYDILITILIFNTNHITKKVSQKKKTKLKKGI